MNGETSGGPEEGPGRAPGRAGSVTEPPEDQGRMQECWETQWQEFLRTPYCTQGSPPESEAAPWGDAKAFLASFEQVAVACGWPRGEWVARLLPALSGGAQQAFSLLAAPEQEDYGQVKAAILRGQALRREKRRQHFRQFCCPQLGDPRRMYSQVQELCCQWLKPERHSKEQILELLVLEQFLAGLPGDVQSRIRACGPDSGAQVVALLEHFLLSRREAHTGMWQEPLQEWAVGLLAAKEEPLDMEEGEISREQAEIFRDSKQSIKEEASLPELEMTQTLVLSSEDQDMGEDELCGAIGVQVEQVMNPRDMAVPYPVAQQIPMQSSQQTTFWKVQQEEENVDSLVGSFGPQLDLAPHPMKKEEMFLQDPVESLILPGQGSGNGKGTWCKGKNSHRGGKKSVGKPKRGRGRTQENIPVTAEVLEEGYRSNIRQGKEPVGVCKESGELPKDLGGGCSNFSPVYTERQKASSSMSGKRNHPKPGIVFEYTGEECNEGPPLEGTIQSKSKLDKNQSSPMKEQNHDGPELGLRLPLNSLAKHQISRTGKKDWKCPDCGKSFSWRSSFSRHQMIHKEEKLLQYPERGEKILQRSHLLICQSNHTGTKPHKCPECGKSFTWRSTLWRHRVIHTGKKPHQCPECGKSFVWRSELLSHQMIHKGMKPHQCPDCGKDFSQRSCLLRHRYTHSEEKPYVCLYCGKGFCWRSELVRHQMIHTGDKPHKCPECGKSFCQRSQLLSHQNVHSGEKPHKCPECGKGFSRKAHLLLHQNIHSGAKPHKCLDCGRSFSQKTCLVAHQYIHTGEKPHKCLNCGKGFCWKSELLKHQNIHTGEKPHKCPNCGKGFTQISNLRRHQKTHTKRNLTAVSEVEELTSDVNTDYQVDVVLVG